MDDATKRIAEGLKRAIQTEGDGYHFFQMAARSTSDPKGQQVFEALALEELDHQRYLRHQYEHVLRTGALDPSARLGAAVDLSGPSPIFSPALRSRIGEAHFEMSALSIGIQLELTTEAYYRGQAVASADPKVRAFFEELAVWEGRHYAALLRQQEELKEDYWAAGSFAPF